MLRTFVAIGPWMTSRITGMRQRAEGLHDELARVDVRVTVASVAPRTPSQTAGRNWPRTLAR